MKLSSTVTEIEDQKEQFSKIRKELEQVELYDLKQLESYEKKIKGQENSAQGIDATKSIESKDQQADKFMVIFQRHVVSSDLGTSISKFREWAQMEDEIRENTTKKIKTEGELKINLQIEKGEQRKNLDQNTVDGAYLQKKDIFHFTKYVKFMVIRKFCDLAQLKIQESWNQIKQDDKLIYVLNIGRVHWEDILFFNTERIAEYVSVSTDLDNLQQIACNRDQQEILSFKYRVFLIHQDIMTLDRQEQVYLLDRGTKTPIMSHSVYSFMNINLVQSVNISLYMLNCTQSLLKGGILVLIYFDIEQFCKETDLNLYKEDFEIVNNAIPPLNELQGAQNDGAQVSFTFQSKNQHIFDHLASIFPVNEIDLISEAKQLDLVVLDQFNFTEYFNQHKQLDEKTNQQFFGQTQISGLSEYGTDAKSVQIFGSNKVVIHSTNLESIFQSINKKLYQFLVFKIENQYFKIQSQLNSSFEFYFCDIKCLHKKIKINKILQENFPFNVISTQVQWSQKKLGKQQNYPIEVSYKDFQIAKNKNTMIQRQRVEFMEGEIVWTNQESTTEKKGYQLDENESQIPVLYHSASVAATSSKNKKIAEIEDLQSQNLQLSQENDRLRYMLAFKDIAISKNSEMINLFSRENLQLQQQVRILEAQALKDKDISSYFLRGSENSKPPSARPLSGRPNDSQIFKNSMNASTSNLNRELLKSIPKFNQSMILYTQSNQSFSSHKSNLTIKVNTSQIQTKSTATATTVASALKERELSPIMQRVQSKEKKQRAKYNENQGINFTGTEIDENEILNALAPERFLIFEEYTQNPQMFFEKLSRESPALKIQFAEEVQTLISDFKTCLKYIKVMRKSIVAYSQIAEDLKPQEMISNTISELYQLIPSEKILFFLVDDYDQNLWTYSNIENQRKLVRINPTSGILKHVLRSGTIAKVQDVQYDPRFDPAIDAFLIQHTQNIICVPIKNQKQEVIAIVQIVNLFKQREYHIEEDIVVNMVVTALGSLLSSSVILEQNIINHQRMKSLMQSSLSLLQVEDMNTLSVESEFCLRSIMSSNLCSLLLVDDEDKTQFYKYNTLSKERTLFDRGWGLFGLANQRKEIICTDAPKAHHSYSELVDVDSLLPSITVPIQSESGEIYGVFQVCRLVTERGKQVSNLDLTFLDLLNQFSQLLVAKIEVINKIKTVVKLIPKQKPI